MITGVVLFTLFGAFFVYANLEKPTLAERIYMSDPTGIAMLAVGRDIPAESVDTYMASQRGVTSYTFAAERGMLVITYSKKLADRNGIISQLSARGLKTEEALPLVNRPQCPVHGYLDMFYKLKYALNIRK